MNPIKYIKNKGVVRALQVLWRFKIPKLQVRLLSVLTRSRSLDDKIIIESHNDFDCNGGALYDYLLENGYNEKIKIIWRLYHPLDRELPKNVEAVPVYGPSWSRAWHLCTAKWITSDCSIAEKVKKEQISIYMTHGIFGVKNIQGLVSIPSSVNCVLSPSSCMDEVIAKGYSMDRSVTRFEHLGYPVLDRLYAGRYSDGYQPVSPDGKKVFLWMPTFRKGVAYGREDAEGSYPYGIPLVENREGLEQLAHFAKQNSALIVIKLHPKQDLSALSFDIPEGICFLTPMGLKASRFDTYDLMLESVALISDYSGASTEYLALDKPISFVLSDLDHYKLGLVDNAERYMPGEKLYSFQDLLDFISNVCAGVDSYKSKRAQFRSWFYRWNDDRSCERVIRYLGIEKQADKIVRVSPI